jgi:hypothetical protein
MVTSAIASATSSQHPLIAASPDLKLGENLSVREKEVVLSEGDSMQGSHYCSMKGTYILQWRVIDQPSSSNQHHTSFDFSLTGPKCKIMHYHELLDSVNFR